MSSDYNHERLQTLQKHYRSAWTTYAAEVECLQSAQENGDGEHILVRVRERVEAAATEYRVARDEMALFLLEVTTPHRLELVATGERESDFAVYRSA